MDETTNNTLFLNTASTTTGNATLTFSTDDGWVPYCMEPTWVPYHETTYKPKWHIAQGYKNQISKMWD